MWEQNICDNAPGVQNEYAEQQNVEGDLRLPALRDETTGLPNTACLEYVMQQDAPHEYLVVVDIVNLKKFNAIYGRDNGDMLLKMVRDYLLSLKIPDSSLYRVRTGDFGILIKNTGGDSGLPLLIAEKIYTRFENKWTIHMGEHRQAVFASGTICIMPLVDGRYASFLDLQNAIEHTLNISQNTSNAAVFCDDIQKSYRYKTALEASLKKAVRDNMKGFHLLYQPIVEPGVAKWSGMEAICCWDSPDLGPVTAGEFIPVAEACGLIGRIGLWILEHAISQTKRWKLELIDRFFLSVNLSPLQFETPNFAQMLKELLYEYDYPPQKLCLEVNESGVVGFTKYTTTAMNRLCDMGILIALNDFGSGVSIISPLHELPINILKTEKSLLTNIESDRKLQNLFRIIISLAHNSNMKVIVEGVQTDAQAQFLLKQGADYLQGEYFRLPLAGQVLKNELCCFSLPSAGLVSMGFGKVDIAGLYHETKYDLSPSQYKMLYDCIRVLFSSAAHDEAINTALMQVGQGLRVSRAYLFMRENDGSFSNTHEWYAPGVKSEKNNRQRIFMEEELPQWGAMLRRDGLFFSSDLQKLENGLAEEMVRHNTKAVLVFPLWKDTELYGFVGFDDCEKNRIWTPEEVQVLHTLTGIITSTLAKMWMQKKLDDQKIRQEIVLNSLNIAIHVTDIDTSEILFANSELSRLYGNQQIIGRKCWEVLENRSEPCPFCFKSELVKNPGAVRQWDHYCQPIERHLRIWGSVIPWTDGKLVHLEYAEDITELKISQEKLEMLASTDMLTLALNRPAFLRSAQSILNSAETNGVPVTVAFVDIDDLKLVNDTMGHAAGDELIRNVVKSLKHSIRESDALGRFGGDEFVIAFNDCRKKDADKRMHEVLTALHVLTGENGQRHNFSYGLAESTELFCVPLDDYIDKLIELADKRMLEQKNTNRTMKRRAHDRNFY